MENFSTEIINLICDDFSDDENLAMSCLWYLYNTTEDDKMKENIKTIYKDNNYCIKCGYKVDDCKNKEGDCEIQE